MSEYYKSRYKRIQVQSGVLERNLLVELWEMATGAERKFGTTTPTKSAFKLVVLGETGSGKTSFLQLLLNYAEQFGNKEFSLDKIRSFVMKAPVQQSKKRKEWESDTTELKKYTALFGGFKLDIIDTPGFCDTRGSDQDKANVDNIIDIVKKELYINCVCLIINGTESRLTSVVKDVVTQIVSILPYNILQNVIVFFTKIRDELSLKFDVALLREFQLSIPKEYCFIIDNPYSRYESLTAAPDKKQIKTLKRDFEDAHETLEEMFEVIKKMKPEKTLKFGEFLEAASNIEVSLVKLKAFHLNKAVVLKLIQSPDTYDGGMGKVTYERRLLKDSDKENVICEVCFSNCHKQCNCWLAFLSIWMCKSINWGSECKGCCHGYDKHWRVKVYYETVTEDVDLQDLSCEDRKKALKMKLSEHETDIAKETCNLESKITEFLSIRSNVIFYKNAIEKIERLEKEVASIPNFTHTKEISSMLKDIKDVINDPTTVTNKEIKRRWACNELGVEDLENFTEEELSRVFRRQAARVHPDATSDESTSTAFKRLNYARDVLKRWFLGN